MSKKGRTVKPQQQQTPAGRPQGAITSKTPSIHERHSTCRMCGSSDMERRAVQNDIEHYQEHGEGEHPTTRRRWQRAMCRKCGTWQTIITDYNP